MDSSITTVPNDHVAFVIAALPVSTRSNPFVPAVTPASCTKVPFETSNSPPTINPEWRLTMRPFVPTMQLLSTFSGFAIPAKFSSNVFCELLGAEIVRLLTVIAAGKFTGVVGKIPTALNPAFVNITDWFAAGKIPSDHDESSQCPLPGLIQLLTCA